MSQPQDSQGTDVRAEQRTYVLIPGAGGAASYWDLVVPLLQEAGHDAIAVDLPGDDPAAGLAEYAGLVTRAADGATGIVLVAQSLGAFTAPLVAAKLDLRALVFVNAMIPVSGETPGQWWDNTSWQQARLAAAERDGYGTDFDPAVYFLHDVAPEIAAAGDPGSESDAVFASVCDFGVWPSVAIKVVTGADDRFFPASFQQALARDRLGLEPDLLPGGHLNALSRPAELARYLLAI